MSYATGTTHYNLPITDGSDKRDWSDTNQAFQDIDAAIYQASEDATTAGSGVTTLDNQINGVGGIDSRLTTVEGDLSDLSGTVTTLSGTVSGHTTQIADVRRDLQDNIEAYNEATATSTHAYNIGDYFYYNDILYKATASIAISDTIVPNTNCTAIDVMSEVAALKSDLKYHQLAMIDTAQGLTMSIGSQIANYAVLSIAAVCNVGGGQSGVLYQTIPTMALISNSHVEEGGSTSDNHLRFAVDASKNIVLEDFHFNGTDYTNSCYLYANVR